jgi:hypothetical protein
MLPLLPAGPPACDRRHHATLRAWRERRVSTFGDDDSEMQKPRRWLKQETSAGRACGNVP